MSSSDFSLSVITVVKNNEFFISRFLKYALLTKSKNVEFLIIDGFSKDLSYEHALAAKTKDSRIKPYQVYDSGIFDAMNYGISKSKYNFVTFINSDDYLIPENFDNYILDFKEYHFEMHEHVYSPIYSSFKNFEKLFCNVPKKINLLHFYRMPIFHCGIISTKQSLYDLHGFNLFYSLSSDHDLYLRGFLRGHKFTYSNKNYVISEEGGIGTKRFKIAFKESFSILYYNLKFKPRKILQFFLLLRFLRTYLHIFILHNTIIKKLYRKLKK